MDTQITCPVMIGRAQYLAWLQERLEQAGERHGQVVLISGEAGIGKSRLIAEARRLAAAREMLILQGYCFEPDRSLPYAPLIDLLRSFCKDRAPQELARTIGPAASDLVRLLPELAELLPDVNPAPELNPAQEKHRIFQVLTQLFIRLATFQPVCIVVEDLHWSDESSLEFLLSLGRKLPFEAVLLLLTYRSEELPAALGHFLAEVDRERLAPEWLLARLSKAEVAAMIEATLAARTVPQGPLPAGAELLDAVYALTEGNPFFVEEVLKSLVEAGSVTQTGGRWSYQRGGDLHIPRSVQDSVQRRMQQLTPPAREVITLAAVIGRRFDFAVIQHLLQVDESALLALIKELIAAQLVVEASAEQFTFRHELIRQAIYNKLLARERQAIHRSVAQALENIFSHPADSHVASLAYHYYQARVWDKVLDYSQRAGEMAHALYAPREAIEHLGQALAAAQRLSVAPSWRVYHLRGLAHAALGEFDAARTDLESALQIVSTASPPDRASAWQILLDLGLLWAARDYTRTWEYYQLAYALAQEMAHPAMLGHCLNHIGNFHLNAERPEEALHCHRQALAIFQQLDERRGVAQTLDLLGMSSLMGGDLVRCVSYNEAALPYFQALGDKHGLVSCLATLTERGISYPTETLVPATVEYANAAREGELALEIAQEIDWRPGEAMALIHLAFRLGPLGVYTRALAAARQSVEIAREIGHQQWMSAAHAALGHLYLDLCALPEARQNLAEALALAEETRSLHWTRTAAGFLARVHVLQQEMAAAEAVLSAVLPPGAPCQTIGERLAWYAHAELALARGEPEQSLATVERLIATARNLGPQGVIPRLWKLRGEALAASQQFPAAEASLQAARAAAAAQGARPLLWRIQVALGWLYQAQTRREAHDHFAEARALIEALAAAIPDISLQQNFLQSALEHIPTPAPTAKHSTPNPEMALRRSFAGLTAREREVAGLIAQGKTNREIADTLVVSERTVESHVANIFGKLNFSSRAQIAAWAVEKRLAK